MDVSIIIINYKTPNLVIDCVESIYEKTKNINFEIIVVDNKSNDNSSFIINNKLNNRIHYVQANKNLGFGKANNLGASYAQGDYLFLLNSDTILMNNAIKVLYDFISENENVGIVGGNLFSKDFRPSSSYSLKFDDLNALINNSKWSSIIKKRFASSRFGHQKKLEEDFNNSEICKKVEYIFGTDLMIKKDLFMAINGFDPEFFMYAEEQDLCFRVKELGFDIYSQPKANIVHLDGASTKEENEFSDKTFKMRLHGGFIYYKKRYGDEGLKLYYKYRLKNINRNLFIAKLFFKKKLYAYFSIQKKCLQEVYSNLK
ncbi:glycosyltransferase family 2 protein [Thomasclavelia cocleata]|uniref:glycosyltransferase family 2 protein n=1 Tax=Thomasclavelia cocleata TaxID=69824 RepID=UPI002557EF6B|nr:glycosyltransferase family 2 protein [Thomasclavelia cocleata]